MKYLKGLRLLVRGGSPGPLPASSLTVLAGALARVNLATAIKAGLKLQGFDCGDPLPPQTALGDAEIAELRSALEKIGAL